ncbi:beta-lactam sensor/signal transducer [Clostridium botulinum]|uniref:Beta-lactam sensor/signal transducer n=1 Tax=Clostridium botulinum TaxID=1491 RepID=A0A846JAP1_CLOBO|nr:M56 family metallopeptidase [Clostridium botulinum]ACA55542.1 peptidase, M56 family protein [Clostridium botulinum A3 str. Loch Maree]NFH64237.1 beta-lactam sensor/signal transducer [Clostridium botulinum]NFJ07184.1 beta-lactam sensor/signal transducer [Clostridium botulinum]NFK14156.1 beta-lactam sensor/signal transducer [Clostridium botulinum]NFM92188.1 beta-lactam sensor/signal transducer [Clostridium botulinum]
MDILVKIFLWVLQASLIASISALLVILILKLFNSHIGVRFQHALLFIIILRLIIPVNIPSNINLFNSLFDKYENKLLNIESKSNTKAAYDVFIERKGYLNDKTRDDKVISSSPLKDTSYKQENTTKEKVITNTLNIASCIWLVGVFSIALFFSIILWKFKVRISNLEQIRGPEIVSLLEECKKKLSINRSIPIYACDDFKAPCIFGVLKPKIYIPKYKYSTNDYKYLSHIFLHELIHYKRKDLIYNFLGTITILIHWFNPIIWFIVKRMKLQREYACDTYVLEILGKEESIEYGMTLINFSKLISSSEKAPQLVIFFETKNQIKRRIKMIKNFKKGSYRMSAAAVICCVLVGGIVFTSNVTAKNNSIVTRVKNKESINKKQDNKFLIDAPVKYYRDLKKVEKGAGFKFKVPDFISENYRVGDIGVIKVSNKVNMLEILFNENRGDKLFRFLASKENIEDILKQNAQQMYKDAKVEISKEVKNLSGINGFNITVKSSGAQEQTAKFFVWQNEGVWYGIETEMKYNKYFSDGEGQVHMNDVATASVDDVGKIASSIKPVKDIKNVNYSVDDNRYKLFVYDNEDLKKAEELLEFAPKLPLNVGKDIAIEDSTVESLGNLNCQFNVFYRFRGVNPIHFTQSKNSDIYKNLKKKGYVEVKDASGKIQHKKAQTLKIGNKEVFKYETSSEDAINEQEKVENYIWKESNFYCKVSISSFNDSQIGNPENPDEIAKVFVNSKSIN